jgi:hypothetical protein
MPSNPKILLRKLVRRAWTKYCGSQNRPRQLVSTLLLTVQVLWHGY